MRFAGPHAAFASSSETERGRGWWCVQRAGQVLAGREGGREGECDGEGERKRAGCSVRARTMRQSAFGLGFSV